MKLLDLTQNTSEWEAFRSTHVGASDIGILMEGSAREVYDLLQTKRGLKEKYVTKAMQHGTDTESEAIEHFIGRSRVDDKEKLTATAESPNDWLMASFDFIDLEKRYVVEAKCPQVLLDTPSEHSNYPRWVWQVQAQLAVSGYEYGQLVIYRDGRMTQETIFRDEVKIKALLEKGKWFNQVLVNFEELPAPAEVVDRGDDSALDWALAYKSLDEKLKELEEEKKVLRDEGIALAGDDSFACAGVKVVRIPARVTIDYEAACKAHNIDLAQYRKLPKSPFTWRITAT